MEAAEKPRILVTGGSGQVGEALLRTLAPLGELFAPSSAELELADGDSIRRAMREVRPRWVVNAGAYTAVDRAESEPELAMAINGTAPAVFADEAKKIGAAVIHFSTDYVFDGSKSTPYLEADATGPLNGYGRSKLAGEIALADSGADHLIFRTSWVYGATGKNFVKSMLRLASEREHLRIVADQLGAPTWSYELARMTAHVIAQIERDSGRDEGSLDLTMRTLKGVYHATGSGVTTWYEFATQAITEFGKLRPEANLATVQAITTEEYPTPAKRPANSLLDCGKLERAFGWRMPDWKDSLALVIEELAGEPRAAGGFTGQSAGMV